MPNISAVIITLNEAENIGRCLQALEGVADEVVVVDAESTDATTDICRQAGAMVIVRPWEGYAPTKNYAMGLASHPYILSIDADEVVSKELANAILAVKPNLTGAYRFNRLTNYCGKWIRHAGWYPDTKLRLFPKGKAKWEGGHVHESLNLENVVSVTRLSGDLLHYSIRNIEDHLERVNRYSTLAAEGMKAKGKRSSVFKLLFSPVARFIRMYLLQGGFLDGRLGFQLCRISAWAVYLRYAKLFELNDQGS